MKIFFRAVLFVLCIILLIFLLFFLGNTELGFDPFMFKMHDWWKPLIVVIGVIVYIIIDNKNNE